MQSRLVGGELRGTNKQYALARILFDSAAGRRKIGENRLPVKIIAQSVHHCYSNSSVIGDFSVDFPMATANVSLTSRRYIADGYSSMY